MLTICIGACFFGGERGPPDCVEHVGVCLLSRDTTADGCFRTETVYLLLDGRKVIKRFETEPTCSAAAPSCVRASARFTTASQLQIVDYLPRGSLQMRVYCCHRACACFTDIAPYKQLMLRGQLVWSVGAENILEEIIQDTCYLL